MKTLLTMRMSFLRVLQTHGNQTVESMTFSTEDNLIQRLSQRSITITFPDENTIFVFVGAASNAGLLRLKMLEMFIKLRT